MHGCAESWQCCPRINSFPVDGDAAKVTCIKTVGAAKAMRLDNTDVQTSSMSGLVTATK